MDVISEIGKWLQESEILPAAMERLGIADKLAEVIGISFGIVVLLGILGCFFGLKLASRSRCGVCDIDADHSRYQTERNNRSGRRYCSGNSVCGVKAGRDVFDCLGYGKLFEYLLDTA